jgi:hypothetical protein
VSTDDELDRVDVEKGDGDLEGIGRGAIGDKDFIVFCAKDGEIDCKTRWPKDGDL